MELTNQDVHEKKAVALNSVGASLLLTVGKLTVGLLTGSLGIISEAAHSALDLCSSLITYFAVRVSGKPADEQHHYGHARIENIAGLIESFLLFGVCLWIVSEAITRLLSREVHMEITFWSYAVLVISIIVDYTRARALDRAAKKFNSQALEADALHFTSDILSSLVVLAGIILSRFGVHKADSLAAIFVAVIVMGAALRLARRTADVLLDKAPEGLDRVITEEVLNTPGIVGVHKVRLRQSGGHVYGDLHVVMGRNISFLKGHKIAGFVEEKLRKYGSDIVVHFEPEDDWDEVTQQMDKTKDKIGEIINGQPGILINFHDLEIFRGPNGVIVNIHVVLPKGVSVEEARNACDCVEDQLQNAIEAAAINFNIEPCAGTCLGCSEECQEKPV